jgi:hypothetical protein
MKKQTAGSHSLSIMELKIDACKMQSPGASGGLCSGQSPLRQRFATAGYSSS